MSRDLFGEPPEFDETRKRYRRDDPDTSKEAAEKILPERLRKLQADVYGFFTKIGEASQLDVENYFGDHRSTYRSRVPELVEKGMLRYTGRSKPQNGRNRRVYGLVPRA